MKSYFQKSVSAAPLAVFRIALGLLLFGSMVRFWANGWIESLYIKPVNYFPFYGFEFIQPLGSYTYILFATCCLSSLLVAIGLCYRTAIVTLFLSFTYIEFIDKSTYLNHYYFISMICLLMIFLPAHVYFSVDASRNRKILSDAVPQWSVDSIKLFVCILYFFAGLAKLNSDWLLQAQPLRIWLPAKNDLPVIGSWFNHTWVAYAFSWAGCLYDLSIPFLLLNRTTRSYAYFAVVVFHLLTSWLFPIGMFPFVMMATALIFFSEGFHERIIAQLARLFNVSKDFLRPAAQYQYHAVVRAVLIPAFVLFFLIQLALPFRCWMYPGELFWTEEGYRFSWRVMLMEKAGYAQFIVQDGSGERIAVDNAKFLTRLQEKMMSTQPDMILQYAHLLRDHYLKKGLKSPRVYVDSYVTLNGRLGKPLIDPTVDLARVEDTFAHKTWILPFENEIAGF